MKAIHRERGFTVIELVVGVTIFGLVAAGFYSVMFSGTRGASTASDVATISQEARLGLNRVLRDTREAGEIEAATATSYTIKVDFNQDKGYSPSPNPPAVPDAEVLTYAYDAAGKRITLNGETLVAGVTAIPGRDVFSYLSNRLEYDWNDNGVTTLLELDDADDHGVTLLSNKLVYVSSVAYAFNITSGNRTTGFFAQAQMRNRR